MSKNKKSKKILLVVVSYNSHSDLIKLFESLQNYDRKYFDLILIDNQSILSSQIMSKDLCIQNKFLYILSDKNGGFAYGSNIGIKYGIENEYEYIGLINPDTIFDQLDFFNNLFSSFKSYNVITPLITYYPDTNKIYSAGGEISPIILMTSMNGKGSSDFSKYKDVHECTFATGCAIFACTDIFKKYGLIPEEYFLYFEEADWCMRLKVENIKIHYVPNIIVRHAVSTGIGYLSKIYIYYMIRNYPIFAKKYIKWYYLFIYYPFYIFIWCGGYAFLLIKNKKMNIIKYIFKGLIS